VFFVREQLPGKPRAPVQNARTIAATPTARRTTGGNHELWTCPGYGQRRDDELGRVPLSQAT
jgi:hypothetical protein